jgi:DNA gyrase/topoisomerase IV subunit A
MRLKALQGLDREKLEREFHELEERIAYFNRVLGDEGLVRQILKRLCFPAQTPALAILGSDGKAVCRIADI